MRGRAGSRDSGNIGPRSVVSSQIIIHIPDVNPRNTISENVVLFFSNYLEIHEKRRKKKQPDFGQFGGARECSDPLFPALIIILISQNIAHGHGIGASYTRRQDLSSHNQTPV